MVSFLHVWALGNFAALARWLGRKADAEHYEAVRRSVADVCEKELWDGRLSLIHISVGAHGKIAALGLFFAQEGRRNKGAGGLHGGELHLRVDCLLYTSRCV